MEGWDGPQTEVKNQSKKDGNQPGPRADTNPSAPRMPLAWWECAGYSQFPKPLASTTSRPPNPSVSNTANGKMETQQAGSAYWYRAGLDGIFTCWNQRNSGKTGSCERWHRDEQDQTQVRGGKGIPLQRLLLPRICLECHHRVGAKETQ